MAQLPAPRDSLVDPSGEPPPPYTARPGQGESIAVAPTSHPAIDRVAASRALDIDVERLAGDHHDDPCVDYETLDRTRILMGTGIDLSTVDASSSIMAAGSSIAVTTNTAGTNTEAGPSTPRTEVTRTLAPQKSITSLIASADAARRAIDASSTTSLVGASASPGTSPRIPQRVSSSTATTPAAS
jgi:hypothetical protein